MANLRPQKSDSTSTDRPQTRSEEINLSKTDLSLHNKQSPKDCSTVVLDLDHTLLAEDGSIPDRARPILSRVQENGIQVIIASGRPPRSVMHIAEQVNAKGPLVAFNGAWTRDSSGAIETHALAQAENPIANTTSKIAAMIEAGLAVHVYTTDKWLVSDFNDPRVQNEISAVGYEPDSLLNKESCPSSPEILKTMVVGSPQLRAQHLWKPANTIVYEAGLSSDIVGHYQSSSLEHGAPVSKLGAIADLLSNQAEANSHAPILERVLAFGDGENDASLLQRAGYGVTMGWGDPLALVAADQVIENGPEHLLDMLSELYL